MLLVKYFYQHFQVFSILYTMKACQFFKICKRFDKEREETLVHQSMRKEKMIKVGLYFITGCLI